MKIVHVYAQNIQMFVDAVKDTDCRLNASKDIDYLLGSLQNYNARDVMGLVVFANPMTKKCLKLIRKFDDLFVFKQMPIIVVCDTASDLHARGYFHVKNSKLFLVNSEDNSLSDVELNAIFTTLVSFSDTMYDLTVCPPEVKEDTASGAGGDVEPEMSEQLVSLLQSLKGSEQYEDSRGPGFAEQNLAWQEE